jgi:hypothetical protein
LKENYGLTATYKYAAKIITLGDLNDGPFNIVSKALGAIANKAMSRR